MTVDVVQEMEDKAIKDFEVFVKNLQNGITTDYKHILNEILFIDVACRLDKVLSIFDKLIW